MSWFRESADIDNNARQFTYMYVNQQWFDLLKSRGINTDAMGYDPVLGRLGVCILGKAYPLDNKLVYRVNWFMVGEFAAIPAEVVQSMIETHERAHHA